MGPAGWFDTNHATLVLQIEGESTWQATADGAHRSLTVGTLLPPGAVVGSDRTGEVHLLLPEGAGTLTLLSGTRIVLAGPGDAFGVYLACGRVEGGLTSGSIRLFNSCGASLLLSPQPGMTAPFSFGDTLPRELWDAMIGLGLNPDLMLPPLASEGLLGVAGPRTFIAPLVEVVPEPGSIGLAAVGILALVWSLRKSVSLRQGCAAGRTGNFSAGAGPAAGVSG